VPRLSRARDRAALIALIEGGIEGTEMPAAQLASREVAQVASFVLRLGQRPPQRLPGDRHQGERLYRGKGGCPLCHAIRGEGGTLGPDLTDVGVRRGADYLRRSVLAPEADLPRSTASYRQDVHLPQNFLAVRAVTRQGREVAGVRVNEDTFSIQIRDIAGDIHSFDKAELAALHRDRGRSPMPSYDGVFGPHELDDLVAFLAGPPWRAVTAAALALLVLAQTGEPTANWLTAGPFASLESLAQGAQIFPDRGPLHYPVTTTSQEAQAYFDQGLRLAYGFNHDEAARSFARAATLDRDCAMCYWGVALTLGPNYNVPILPDRTRTMWRALGRAQALAGRTRPVEQALITALGTRYHGPAPIDAQAQQPYNVAYAQAMRAVAQRFPDDVDVQVLFAEALMDTNPWKLWSHDAVPAPGTMEI
jgi:putative heme-binding domain-containing protein